MFDNPDGEPEAGVGAEDAPGDDGSRGSGRGGSRPAPEDRWLHVVRRRAIESRLSEAPNEGGGVAEPRGERDK